MVSLFRIRDIDQRNILLYAFFYASTQLLNLLINRGAAVGYRNEKGESVLSTILNHNYFQEKIISKAAQKLDIMWRAGMLIGYDSFLYIRLTNEIFN
jgi:hypothetical protein